MSTHVSDDLLKFLS